MCLVLSHHYSVSVRCILLELCYDAASSILENPNEHVVEDTNRYCAISLHRLAPKSSSLDRRQLAQRHKPGQENDRSCRNHTNTLIPSSSHEAAAACVSSLTNSY